MLRPRTALLVSLLLLVVGSRGDAAIQLIANLTNSQENPPVVPSLVGGPPGSRPASFGVATFTLNDAMTAMTFSATIFNIDFTGTQTPDTNDNLTLAHIHAPAPPGMNAGVVWGFFGTPFNDNNPNDVVINPFLTGVGGTISGKWDAPEGNNTTLTAQLQNILSGSSYINFHTMQFGGGEVRGQITTAIPEPSALVLLGIGAVGLVGYGWRARRRTR